jgi:hypothetical protein
MFRHMHLTRNLWGPIEAMAAAACATGLRICGWVKPDDCLLCRSFSAALLSCRGRSCHCM